MTKRLTHERLEEIRSHVDSGHYPNHWITERELLSELDAVRAENELFQKRDCLAQIYVSLCKSVSHLDRERNWLMVENVKLRRECDLMAVDVVRLRERIEKLRAELKRYTYFHDHYDCSSQKVLDHDLAQDNTDKSQ
jgi:hypothetical protein